jgi:hypothetical protein
MGHRPEGVAEIDLDRIVIGEGHRRTAGDIQALAESLREVGVVTHIIHPTRSILM